VSVPLRHVGLNALVLYPGRTGGLETHILQLVPDLAAARPDLRFTVFATADASEGLLSGPAAGSADIVSHPLLGRPGARVMGELAALPLLAARRSVDVLHSLGVTAPIALRSASVVTIGDMIWHHHPDSLDALTRLWWRAAVPRGARRAERVITFTDASRREIVSTLGVPPERIDVIAPGPGAEPAPEATPARVLRDRLGLTEEPIVLSVAAKRPHKNLLGLIRAMVAIRAQVEDAVLVLPGRQTPHEQVLRAEATQLGLTDAVRFWGHVDAADLEGLYRCASCFVLPSLREGFGLPVLEAFARGLPVACSNVPALAEVAGSGALLFNPQEPDDIARAVVALLRDAGLRSRTASAGEQRRLEFSRERTAAATIETYERAWAERCADSSNASS
jgi:glycosyltransferase involved in cell wall biosynthesis